MEEINLTLKIYTNTKIKFQNFTTAVPYIDKVPVPILEVLPIDLEVLLPIIEYFPPIIGVRYQVMVDHRLEEITS
jgi:hypothetical protein